MPYTGKVAVVTGAGSGIGQLAATTFAHTGAAVAALDVNETGLAETAKSFDTIHTFKADVTDYDTLKPWLRKLSPSLDSLTGSIMRQASCLWAKFLIWNYNHKVEGW